jgi:alkanesulfonate monooxygenase SsuD/methylene tetrahydromethanopterin reductase-like flavin-dependent oxidoreductase (luciferase family)
MRLGLIHINMGPMSRPEALVSGARTAEAAGFDSVGAGEHVVLPDPQAPDGAARAIEAGVTAVAGLSLP